MRKFILAVLTLTLTSPAFAEVTDAFSDLGCTRITSSSSTWSAATAEDNVDKINAWMDDAAVSDAEAVLYIPNGYIAINDSLGSPAGTISGYNGGQPFVALPSGMQIVCGGGWANGRYYVTQDTVNTRTAGFMWVGDDSTPMIRLSRNGNKIVGNFYGYRYTSGANPPTWSSPPAATRCRAAIELVQHPGDWACGHHDISGTFTGFNTAVRFVSSSNHTDHCHFGRLTFRDCLTDVYCDNLQALGHHFDFIEHYCPNQLHSTVLNYFRGGRVAVKQLLITGNYGVTVANAVGSGTGATAKNGAYFSINDVGIDRALLEATSGRAYAEASDEEVTAADQSGSIRLTIPTPIPTGQAIKFTTNGTLPGNLATGTTYYAISDDATHCWLATSLSNAFAGTKIAYINAGSGTHTMLRSMYTEVATASDSGGKLLMTFATAITTGRAVKFNASGVVPTGLIADKTYYAIYDSPTTCFLAMSQEDALSGIKIDFTNSGTGSIIMTRFWSYFRLFEQPANGDCHVTIDGTLAWSGEDLTSSPAWYNVNQESVVSVPAITNSGFSRTIELDVWGLDDATARRYSPHQHLETTASGTNYELTATPATLNFGTTDPTVTLHQQGDWKLGGWVRLYFNGYTAGAGRTVTFKLQRTTSTAAEIDGSSTSLVTGVVTAQTGEYVDVVLPTVLYRSNIENVDIALQGSVDSVSGDTGTIECSAAQIFAQRLRGR